EDSPLYPRELLRELLLGLHSMCRGAESVYFNGRTNITSARFLVFGVKDLIHANSSVKDALLFNLLSYLSDQLLTKGNTVATLDELYLWLSNLTTIEYIRNCLKRVRKRNSALILASQNLEDFDIQGVRELTRPLFAIPTHQFLFHGGKVDKKFYMDNLQLESAEYDLISSPNNGICLFKSGADRNLLDVHAPPHKHALITGGGG
ncbi:MAG: type VI secretion protein, partial [Clostridiales bacterium]|nr:type VI secretion protein [Clostridiales bacterium]